MLVSRSTAAKPWTLMFSKRFHSGVSFLQLAMAAAVASRQKSSQVAFATPGLSSTTSTCKPANDIPLDISSAYRKTDTARQRRTGLTSTCDRQPATATSRRQPTIPLPDPTAADCPGSDGSGRPPSRRLRVEWPGGKRFEQHRRYQLDGRHLFWQQHLGQRLGGGEVLPVHANQRHQRLPGPELVGPVDNRRDRQRHVH